MISCYCIIQQGVKHRLGRPPIFLFKSPYISALILGRHEAFSVIPAVGFRAMLGDAHLQPAAPPQVGFTLIMINDKICCFVCASRSLKY